MGSDIEMFNTTAYTRMIRCMRSALNHIHVIKFNLTFLAAASQSESAQAPYILLANYRFIHQLSLDGNRLRTIISDPSERTGIYTVDYHIRYDIYRFN